MKYINENDSDIYTENKAYTEIHRLHGMLKGANIPHTMKRFMDGWQICYPVEDPQERVCDAIEHCGSYGHGADLLELMGLLTDEELPGDSVVGFLTAEEVFSRIKKHWSDRNGASNEM